jgi:hypothetical protein
MSASSIIRERECRYSELLYSSVQLYQRGESISLCVRHRVGSSQSGHPPKLLFVVDLKNCSAIEVVCKTTEKRNFA